jgi:hypothetical protein
VPSPAPGAALAIIVAAGTSAADARLNRDAIIVSIVIIFILMAIVVFLVWWVGRKRKVFLDRQRELYKAGRHTLAVADALAGEINRAPRSLSKSARREFDRAEALRSHAGATLDHAGTDIHLAEGNREAAEAVVLLGQLRARAGVETLTPPARCYYCGREDGVFQDMVIGADADPRLTVRACPECARIVLTGGRPKLAVEAYFGTQVPWWAIPNNLWYVAYGGEAWQYWLPIVTGQTLEGWFAGGWAQEVPGLPTASA